MRKRRQDISLERAREVFVYDPADGVLRWRITIGQRAIAGNVAGSQKDAYQRVRVDGVNYYVHCLIWFIEKGEWPPEEIDHSDTDGSNNRFDNLRLATFSQNRANTNIRSDNTSGIKGVSKVGNRWKAQICVNKTIIYLGLFKTKKEAGEKYAEESAKRFGAFARPAVEENLNGSI